MSYFDATFKDRDLRLTGGCQSVVKIMNGAGVIPVIRNYEVCCSHDLDWTDDEGGLRRLRKRIGDVIKASRAKKVVFSCREYLRTVNLDYQDFLGDFDLEMQHISEFVDDLAQEGRLKFKEGTREVTSRDSCRLGRHVGICGQPRNALKGANAEAVEYLPVELSGNNLKCSPYIYPNCQRSVRETGKGKRAFSIRVTEIRKGKQVKSLLT